MAVTETVKIVFEVDNKPISDTVTDLQQLGKVTEQDAAKFKQLGEASKQAAKDVTTLDKSIENVVDTSKDVSKSSDGFVSLRTKVKEAKEEVQRLSDKFGEFSPQANAARARAGELADKMSDLNRQVGLLNPEAKIKAFTALGQGIVGSFQVATGALQAFGSKNEEVQAIAQKLQGALNVVQGLQSLKQLKESYEDVKIVLGFTATAQQALNVAQVQGAAASGTAATGIRALTAALASNPITAAAVAIGALAGAFLVLGKNAEEATQKSAKLLEIEAERKRLAGEEVSSARALAVARGILTETDVKRQEIDQKEVELLAKKREELAALAPEYKILKKQLDDFIKGGGTKEMFWASRTEEARDVIDGYEEIQKQIISIENTGRNERAKLDQDERTAKIEDLKKRLDQTNAALEKQNQDEKAAAEKRKQIRVQAIQDEIAALQEAQRGELIGVDDEIKRIQIIDSYRSKIKDKELEKAKLTGESKVLIEQKYNNDIKQSFEDLFKFLEDQRDKDVADADKAAQDKKDKEVKAAEEAEKKKTEAFKKAEEEREKIRQNTIDQSFEVYGQLFDISEELRKRDEEASISSIEKQKEQGLITEQEYQKQLKKIRQKSAEDDKKAQIFQATMSAAQAILSALATVSLDPTARIRAVAFASIVGALNLAKIIATPIPKFNKGTLSVPGIDTGGDSVMAMLRPGEAVIPTDTNRSYAPSIKAIYQKQIKPSEINTFVLNKLSGRGSIGRDTAITASVDTFALSKAMNKNRAVEVTNANIVGKVIANEMMKAYNPRR